MSLFLPYDESDYLLSVDGNYDHESANVIANLAFDAGVDVEIAECFAEDAGIAFGGGFITTHCTPACDNLLCDRHPAGPLSRTDYLAYGLD